MTKQKNPWIFKNQWTLKNAKKLGREFIRLKTAKKSLQKKCGIKTTAHTLLEMFFFFNTHNIKYFFYTSL